jgi:taurine dioxygenase
VRDDKELGTQGSTDLDWHTDYASPERVGILSFLEAVILPRKGSGGDTYFANTYAAYETLPKELVDRIDGLEAIYRTDSASTYKIDEDRFAAETVHPIVVTNPTTDRKAIYVNPRHTRQVVGLSKEDSACLLGNLFRHQTSQRFVYRHVWITGDLAV